MLQVAQLEPNSQAVPPRLFHRARLRRQEALRRGESRRRIKAEVLVLYLPAGPRQIRPETQPCAALPSISRSCASALQAPDQSILARGASPSSHSVARIAVKAKGIVADAVGCDLNMACETLNAA